MLHDATVWKNVWEGEDEEGLKDEMAERRSTIRGKKRQGMGKCIAESE